MINKNEIKKQLIKVENVDYVWITDAGNLIIHANPEISKPIISYTSTLFKECNEIACNITAQYANWMKGICSKKDTISAIAAKADWFYKEKGRKTISNVESNLKLREQLAQRYLSAIDKDVENITEVMRNFSCHEITVWHCFTPDGIGYYTISDGKIKKYVRSAYILEQVGGCISLAVYERLYIAQIYLTKYLTEVKNRLLTPKCEKTSSAHINMPIKCLYISYILDDLSKDMWSSCESEIRRRIAYGYQAEFKGKYAEEISAYERYMDDVSNLYTYYNGDSNYEYTYVSEVIRTAVNKIYQKRDDLEACGCWDDAKKTISQLNSISIDFLQEGE